jgi:hypothetical protein
MPANASPRDVLAGPQRSRKAKRQRCERPGQTKKPPAKVVDVGEHFAFCVVGADKLGLVIPLLDPALLVLADIRAARRGDSR